MDRTQLTPIQQLLSERLNNANTYARQAVAKSAGLSNFKRSAYYLEISKHLTGFSREPAGKNCWVIMGGLRGTGKTTLLSQLYLEWSEEAGHPAKIFFLSLDEAYGISASFTDIEKVIETELGEKLTSYKHPVYIFLDEVHFINKWSVNAKIWHDRCDQLFLLCTGSSAISFWTNADIARRAKIINIHPLSLPEFVSMKIISQPHYKRAAKEVDRQSVGGGVEELGLLANQISLSLRQCFAQPKSAEAVFGVVQEQNNKLADYIKKLEAMNFSGGIELNLMVRQYVGRYMSLPYTVSEVQYGPSPTSTVDECEEIGIDEEAVRVSITQTLENIFNKDLNILHSFNQATRAVFPSLLLALANSDATELSTLSKKLRVNIQTLQSMLKVLVDGQVVSAVPPLGASTGKISKPYKYLFNSPAIRQALSPIIIEEEGGNNPQSSPLRGKLLEDAVHLSFRRIFKSPLTDPQVEYDASSGGADFVIMPRSGIKQDAVVVEVGQNKTSHRQVEKTLTRAGGLGVVITDTDQPRLVANSPIVYMPLRLFLMM